jgi:hypothetical protein
LYKKLCHQSYIGSSWEHPSNVGELLRLTRDALVPHIGVEGMKRVNATFVQRDYRHVECDVVLTAPFRGTRKTRDTRRVIVYILIEHQSEPEELMMLRVADYTIQIYKYQERQWRRKHRSLAGIRFDPVLPIVFYTGTRRWDALTPLRDLVDFGELFGERIPALEPIFLNLSGVDPKQLVSDGSFFGRLLHVVQQREAPAEGFERVLREEVSELEGMRGAERARWLELLSYLMALVYHERSPSEHRALQEVIEASVQEDQERREVRNMGKTIADTLREEGEKKGELRALRRTLLEQLEEKFDDLPAATQTTIKHTDSVKQLQQWLRRLVSARTLAELEITPKG